MALEGNFDLYYLFVELIFGNLFSAFLAVCLILLIIGVMTRMSFVTIGYIVTLFSATYLTLWYGGFFVMIFFVFSSGYAGLEIYRYLKEAQS